MAATDAAANHRHNTQDQRLATADETTPQTESRVRCIRWFAGGSYEKYDAKLRIANMNGAWIPVTERLPEENTDVLVSVDENSDDCGMHVCDYYDGKFSRAEAGYIWGVTHWMPLPAPPSDTK